MGTKIAASETSAIPAERKLSAEPGPIDQAAGAKISATEVGIALWKTIAPVMLPRAQGVLSLPDPDHAVELLGQLGRDRCDDEGQQRGSTPREAARSCTAPTKNVAPTMMQPSASRTWRPTIRSRGTGWWRRAAIEVAQPERREVRVGLARLGAEVPADIPAVEHEQRDRDTDLGKLEAGRQQGRRRSPGRSRARTSGDRAGAPADPRRPRHPGGGAGGRRGSRPRSRTWRACRA